MTFRLAWLCVLVLALVACSDAVTGGAALDAAGDGAQGAADAAGDASSQDALGDSDTRPVDTVANDANGDGHVTDAASLRDVSGGPDGQAGDALDATLPDAVAPDAGDAGADGALPDVPEPDAPDTAAGDATDATDGGATDSTDGGAADSTDGGAADATDPDAGSPLVVCAPEPPWSRGTRGVGGTVTFSELMIDPPGDKDLEWVELHNPMTLDVDISGWRLDGAVAYTFAEGTILPGGAYLVVAADPGLLAATGGVAGALGPFDGHLSNDGEELQLISNSGRLMDSVDYTAREPWPLAPFGSGASLAKVNPDAGSERAEDWRASASLGGTPGERNFPDPEPVTTYGPLVELGATWRFDSTDVAPPGWWAAPDFDDAAWGEGQAAFFAGDGPSTTASVTAQVTADNFFALYTGPASGEGLSLIGRDTTGDWSTVETFGFDIAASDHAFIAAWEGPGDSGSPQMMVAQLTLPDGATLETSTGAFEVVLGPDGANPGGALSDPPPAPDALALLVAAADEAGSWAPPAVQADKAQAPWGWAIGSAFTGSPKVVWADTFAAASLTNTLETFALFRSVEPIIPPLGATELPAGPTTAYFRTTFVLGGAPELAKLWIEPLVDDGAVFYLNGVEVYRQNMPDGPVSHSTLASQAVEAPALGFAVPLPTGALLAGDNVLAVEVHQAQAGDADMTFGARLLASTTTPGAAIGVPTLVFNEVSAGGSALWVELANATESPIDLSGATIVTGGGALPVGAGALMPSALLLVDASALVASAEAGDRLFLLGPSGEVLDAVALAGVPRARDALGYGPWLTPEVATPGAPNQVALNDAVVINEIMFHAAPQSETGAPIVASDEEWVELHNRTGEPVDVSGWQLVDAVRATLPAGTILPPLGYLVVARDPAALSIAHPGAPIVGGLDGKLSNSGERLTLRDPCGNPVDSVRYYDGGRWPSSADGGGSSLELRNPWIHNDIGEAWAASDEASAAEWQTVTYEGPAEKSAVGPDGQWQELVLGLLDAGEVLLDDVSVVVDPYGEAKELVQDGAFDTGDAVGWRIIGNHGHSEVVPDPSDPSNPVLRLVATGPTEHMNNHAETTLADGHVITNGLVYRISYRARWVTGSNLLNTRLYFNRLAKTARVARPTAHGTPGASNSAFEANPGPLLDALRHAPAVPAPFEPVTISVVADDPDGMAQLVAWTSVDGGPFEATPMVASGGRYEATVQGQAPATVVQVYVEATDALGAVSLFPTGGPASRALWKVDDSLAKGGPLQDLRIVMTPADVELLHATTNLMSNDMLGSTVILDEREIHYDVGVRLKGSQRGRPQVARLGWSLAFQPDSPLRGVYRKVMVDRSEGVGYGQREMLVNQMMTHAGSVTGEYNDLVHVVAPRLEHTGAAELQLARFTDLLLDAQFEDGGDGLLHEYELVYYPTTTDDGTPEGKKLPQPDNVVGVSIKGLGDDPESYRHTYAIDNNRWRDDLSQIATFASVMGLSGEAFHSQIDAVMDVDQWLRAFAFGALTGCVDNYATGSQHNAVLYVRPSDQRVLLFLHDLDFFPGSPASAVVSNSDLKKIIGDPVKARVFYGHLWDIIETTANDAYMAHWRDRFTALLPGQPFAAHHQFLVQRAQHVLDGAPDAVLKVFPGAPFAITTGGGATLTTDSHDVILQGTGWIDVATIRRTGAADDLLLSWLDKTTWSAPIALACGTNGVVLLARDRYGAIVGSAALTVEVEAADCP